MPGLIPFLGASRVSFHRASIPLFAFQPNRTPAADARVPELLALAGCVDGVPAEEPVNKS